MIRNKTVTGISTVLKRLEYSQVVRRRFLVPTFKGSSPFTPVHRSNSFFFLADAAPESYLLEKGHHSQSMSSFSSLGPRFPLRGAFNCSTFREIEIYIRVHSFFPLPEVYPLPEDFPSPERCRRSTFQGGGRPMEDNRRAWIFRF